MSSARASALKAVKVGDVIYGVSDSGTEKLLLVYQANATGFLARHITSQTWAEFGSDGKTRPIPAGGNCTILSTATLPADQYAIAVGLDRKMRTARRNEDYKLSAAEIQLILTYGDFFRQHPLPAE